MRFNNLLFAVSILFAMAVASCSTPKDVAYFQEMAIQTPSQVDVKSVVIKPNDKLSIIVNSRDPMVANMFNLPYTNRLLGQTSALANNNTSQGVSAYTVNQDGDIDFPELGTIHVGGLTRMEVAGVIKGMLIGRDLVKDAVVTVELVNAQASVLGEVNKPGRYPIDRDDMTILDLLGSAGDLTIYGMRDNIKLIRTVDGQQTTYQVSLLSGNDLTSSPAYYIQQDDVVYVEPNPTRKRQSQLNANTVQSTSFWVSIASLAVTITAIIVR
ncbi:MAG: polysaccharide biosynthesis/export family protein [Duncaniella sp.]